MTSERWSQIEELFHAARELAPQLRGAFLAKACGGDDTLRLEIERLLLASERSGELLAPVSLRPADSPIVAPYPPGSSVQHFTLLEKIGEGGMGVVYKARDQRLERLVAIKFLLPRRAMESGCVDRFMQEARAASALDHPNICTIYGIDQTADGHFFIVMAYYEGETIRVKIRRGPVPLEDACGIVIQAAQALAKAHSIGVVHRDIKPENLMVTRDGILKILDFGIAKLGETPRLTRPGFAVGTLAYMSPEQLRDREVDGRADIWSLGVVFYELLTGRTPFVAPGRRGMADGSISAGTQLPAAGAQRWPEGLEAIMQSALAEEPSRRYPDMAALVADLQALHEGNRRKSGRPAAGPGSAPSVAVMPFVNLSFEPENEYFSDGLTEELIHALSQVKGLRVVSRMTSFQFKGKASDVREIGRMLNATAVVEGSVRMTGNRLRVTAQLTEASDGYQLWSGRYDRHLDDMFATQDEIAQTIVQTLMLRFPLHPVPAPAVHDMRDPEAHRLYLKGRFQCRHRNPENLQRGARYLEEAVRKDPLSAQAHCGLSEAWLLQGTWGLLNPHDAWIRARKAAEEALRLDNNLASAHALLASMFAVDGWKWSEARREFDIALNLDPDDTLARSLYSSYYLMPLGLLEEARQQESRVLELDPLSPASHVTLGWIELFLQNHDAAFSESAYAIELAPHFLEAYCIQSLARLRQARLAEALAPLDAAKRTMPDHTFLLSLLSVVAASMGRSAEARECRVRLEQLSALQYVAPTHLAWACLATGEPDSAFEWLEKAAEMRDSMMIYLAVAPMYAFIRGDSRYGRLLERLGLSGVEPGY